jgi:cytochrome c oxidase subunit 4
MSEHNTEHSSHTTHHHISPASLYWGIWIGLMILTVITVLAYYIPLWLNISLGAGNVIIAMAIATTKASLVVLVFMGLKYDKKFNAIAFLSSLIFLGLFLAFTLLDINTREDALPFAKPIYSGKDIPLEGGHSTGAAPAATTSQSPVSAAPGASPAASHAAGAAKKEEAKPAASASPAGAAKH